MLLLQDRTLLRCEDKNTQNFFFKVCLLVALAWVGIGLIAVLAAPTWLTMANRPKSSVWLTDSMQAVNLSTWLAARHYTRFHLGLGEVL